MQRKSFIQSRRIFILTVLVFISTSSFSQDGILDNSFDGDGKVTTSFGQGSDEGHSTIVQLDGKILVAGIRYDMSNNFALVRYNVDGSLDNSFSDDGKVTTHMGYTTPNVYAIALQPDGKILVAGNINTSNTWIDNFDFAIVRYHSNGSLDSSFDIDGKLFTDIAGGNDVAYSIAIQSDGKILVAGRSQLSSGHYRFAVVRYNTKGDLDNSFGNNGKVITSIGSAYDFGQSIALQPNGKILVAGYSYIGTSYDFAVVRYNNNGSLDSTFDNDGKVTTSLGAGDDFGTSIALQPNGKILVAGNKGILTAASPKSQFAIVRYNYNGSLDNSFDNDGIVITAIDTVLNKCKSIVIQPNGKILVSGFIASGFTADFAIARYNSNGSLDNSFDSDGIQTTNIGSYDWCASMALQPDGKIILAGFSIITQKSYFSVVRYHNCSIKFSPASGSALNTGTIGVPYSSTITSAIAGVSYTATGLPAGLSMSSTGVISGTPTTAISTPLNVTITATYGSCSESLNYTLEICRKFKIFAGKDNKLASGILGNTYRETITSDIKGTSFTAKGLPSGLTISSEGVISGNLNANIATPKIITIIATHENCIDWQVYDTIAYVKPIIKMVANKVPNSLDSINNFSNTDLVNVYPNPSKSNFNIDFSGLNIGRADILVYDICGKLISSTSAENKVLISLENYSNGIYTFELSNQKTRIRKHLIKE